MSLLVKKFARVRTDSDCPKKAFLGDFKLLFKNKQIGDYQAKIPGRFTVACFWTGLSNRFFNKKTI